MPDGSTLNAPPRWPELDCHRGLVHPYRFFGSYEEAVSAYDDNTDDLEAARAVIERAFNELRQQAETAKPGVRRVIHEMLTWLVDLDADTCGWALEKQAAAEVWVHDE